MIITPTETRFNHVVAFDVGKAELVVHILPTDTQHRLPNTPAAVRRLLRQQLQHNRRQQLGSLLVVCEATGGYERHVLEAALALGLAVHRAHGARIRMFARFQGRQAKTDPIDARLIARYALSTPELSIYRPPSPQQQALTALCKRRDQLLTMLRMELNRTEQVRPAGTGTSLSRHIRWLKAECKTIEAEIDALIRDTPELCRKASLMQTVKGVGPRTAAACLAQLPELGSLSKAQAAGIAGLAPHANDSGQHTGKRHIGGGRSALRTSLYMAALVARARNPRLKAFAQNLTARGKPNKLVLTAIMRKLIVILNAIIASDKPAYP
jgi:transposase